MSRRVVGYTSGVFDMFHIGHLRLLRRAREQCDYLIVGVNSDDLTMGYKNKRPVTGENERLAIVSAIKYVDKAVIVNELTGLNKEGRMLAYDLFHPDIFFIGSDHQNDLRWIKVSEYLENKSKVVFLSYTEITSSSKLMDVRHDRVED